MNMTDSKKRKRRGPGAPPPKGLEARMEHGNVCTAKRTNGQPCANFAINGSHVCRIHGGAAPQVRARAQTRILMASDLAARKLIEMLSSSKVADNIKLAAAKDLLDRANLGAKSSVEVTLEKGRSFDDVIEASLVEVGTPDELDEFDALDAVIVDVEPEPPVQTRHDRKAFREHDRAAARPTLPEPEPLPAVLATPDDEQPNAQPRRSADDAANQRSREAYMEAIAAGHSTRYAESAARRAASGGAQNGPRYARRAPRDDDE